MLGLLGFVFGVLSYVVFERVMSRVALYRARHRIQIRIPEPPTNLCLECGAFHDKYPGGCPLVAAGAKRLETKR